MKIKTDNLRNFAFPLYKRYPQQTKPQPAYLSIDLDSEEVSAGFDPEIGGAVPARVGNGEIVRVAISPYWDGDALADLLENDSAVRDALQIALDNSEDGACESLRELIESREDQNNQNAVWDACQYLHGVRHEYINSYVDALKTGQDVDVASEVQAIEQDNEKDPDGRFLLLENVEEFVERCIRAAKELVDSEG